MNSKVKNKKRKLPLKLLNRKLRNPKRLLKLLLRYRLVLKKIILSSLPLRKKSTPRLSKPNS